jgi:pimeloyl-ACP methyl ester carboxylesterase
MIRKLPRVLAGLVALPVLAAAGFVVRNMNYARWDARRVKRAGFVEKTVDIDGSALHYAEGPASGPPLLLIHGQVTDWQYWNRVLPELSRHFHVFAIDCYGHGRSARVPEKYTAHALAADLERFLRDVVGKPAIVAGHSSGGLIASVLAANAPDRVAGVVLEDPPFFSSVLPRAEKTFNFVDLSTTAHGFLESGEADFMSYYIRHAMLWELFKGAKAWTQREALRYREAHPGEPVKLYFMPPAINEVFRGTESYDPRFAEAFYNNSFHEDFDHADTLRRITIPAVLIHANWSYSESGILLAAMDAEDAERARSLIKDVEFFKVDSGHGFHFEKPDEFIRILMRFKERVYA